MNIQNTDHTAIILRCRYFTTKPSYTYGKYQRSTDNSSVPS